VLNVWIQGKHDNSVQSDFLKFWKEFW